MSAHVLVNLLNELWKSDKMRGLQLFEESSNLGFLLLLTFCSL